jgi:hypothetical protein
MEKPEEFPKAESRNIRAYLLVNAIKWGLILGLPQIIGMFAWKYQFNVDALDADFFGISCFTMFFSLLAGYLVSIIGWRKIKEGTG